jgi:hypothetical protein
MSDRMTAAEYRASLKPVKSAPRANTPAEDDIQKTLCSALRQCGYEVLETGKDRRSLIGRLAKALEWMVRKDIEFGVLFGTITKIVSEWNNNDAGLPDLFVTHPEWPVGEWLGIELKTETGKLRPAQKELHDKGRTVVARSVAGGLEMVGYVERKLDANTVLADAEKRKAKVLSMATQFQEMGK